MFDEIILLTGASGFVGFRILELLLQRESHVRLAVRSEAEYADIERALARLQRSTTRIGHAIVPDMAQSSAFGEAIVGVSYVIHVASPVPAPSDDLEASFIRPAVDITTGLLQTALQTPERTIKKVVITSSIAAVTSPDSQEFDADTIVSDPEGPFADEFIAYAASKKLALNAIRRIIAEEKPYFDIVNIMPSFVIGPNGFANSRKGYVAGSNVFALAPLLGMKMEREIPGCPCHIDDVAAVHVAALSPSISGYRNFGVNSDGMKGIEWNSAIEIVKKRLPERIGADGFPLEGSVPTSKAAFDASKTEQELRIKFKDFETMVVDVAKAYLATEA